MEEWKMLKEYGVLVSNLGRVKDPGTNRIIPQHPVGLSDRRYQSVRIESHKNSFRVHRLVALAFLPNPENKPFVDHINGDPCDNFVSNLQWVTEKENTNLALTRDYEGKPGRKRVDTSHIDLELVYTRWKNGEYLKDMAIEFGVSTTMMTKRMREYRIENDLD